MPLKSRHYVKHYAIIYNLHWFATRYKAKEYSKKRYLRTLKQTKSNQVLQ